jgi:hypothetical protein
LIRQEGGEHRLLSISASRIFSRPSLFQAALQFIESFFPLISASRPLSLLPAFFYIAASRGFAFLFLCLQSIPPFPMAAFAVATTLSSLFQKNISSSTFTHSEMQKTPIEKISSLFIPSLSFLPITL